MSTLTLRNGQKASFSQVPEYPFAEFADLFKSFITQGFSVSSYFGVPSGDGLMLLAVLTNRNQGNLALFRTRIEKTFPSLTPEIPQVHWFEREIAEQYGVVPERHPWLKPIRFHKSYNGSLDAWNRADEAIEPCVTDYFRVQGPEVHQVAVGPVHAGIIEPGHFRFQCHGEKVFHLEIELGYQHRGIERAILRAPLGKAIHLIQTLAGDTTIGHTTAWARNLESLSDTVIPARAHAIRGIALELERIANHTGDLGALAGDVGFLPTASYCGRLRGDYLNMTGSVCGNRFGRNLVRPGGVTQDIAAELAADLNKRASTTWKLTENAVDLLWSTSSVLGRFRGTGAVSSEDAVRAGLVGVAARACGLNIDVRSDLPWGIYQTHAVPSVILFSGDVHARAVIRYLESRHSVQFLKEELKMLPDTPTFQSTGALEGDSIVVSLVEGWRGEICHVALTGADGNLSHYKITDPSFHNWFGLALALRDQQISDFPLCNKSFNLSYCGHDL